MPTGQHSDPTDEGADAWSQLRRHRPRAGWSLAEAERRHGAAEQAAPPPPTALAIAREQLSRVDEVVGEQPGPTVIDLDKLQRCDDPLRSALQTYTDDILARRGTAAAGGFVFVREHDLDTLGELLGCNPDEVTDTLERLGVLST
jgi:hypothetical protein